MRFLDDELLLLVKLIVCFDYKEVFEDFTHLVWINYFCVIILGPEVELTLLLRE